TSAFKLGDWTVEPDLNRLTADGGVEVKVEPKLMDVLVYLSRRQGEVASSDEIVEAVWGGQPMSDNPVYNAIGRLRQVLDDDPKNPRYIETISSRGYRVIAKVSTAESTSLQADAPLTSGSARRLLIAASVFVVAVVLIIVVLLAVRDPAEPSTHTLISSFPGSHSMPNFSPDGTQIAFVSNETGAWQVWILDLATMQRRRLTEAPSFRPRWSPVGDRILYDARASIWSVSAAGGDGQQLITEGYNSDWAPDGSRFVFERRGEIWTAGADGSDQVRIEGVPAQDVPLATRRPTYSPDGRYIAFFHAGISPLGDWWLAPTDGGSPRQLTFDKARGGWAAFTSDARHLIISSQRSGSKTLWKVPVDGGEPVPVTIGAGDDDSPAVHDSQLIFSSRQDRFTVCVTNFESGETRELYASANDIVMPRFSPDNSEVAFFTMLDKGDIQVIAVPASGGRERFVTSDEGARNQAHEWSADGAAMYFYRTEPTPAFMRNDANGGAAEIVVDGWNWIKENSAQVHPSKPKIIYSRMDRGQPVETMVRDMTTGAESRFPALLYWARWSHSGDRIAASRPLQGQLPELVVCDESGIDCRLLGQNGWQPTWSGDDSRIYFQRPGPDGLTFLSVDVADLSVEEHGVLGPMTPIGTVYDVSDSGEVTWVRYDRGTGELWLTQISE
ncbi:MAG: winged helix-turn-helix domain-containing protein, partial [Woeseiaceae bacterium]